ncbi:MAG: hypothetical protein KDD69_13640 [Bdellovibrionales bacterium]|nr:hypothetical protein [Bdellovibrionales bacterium]
MSSVEKLPRRIVVTEVLESRYGPGLRPTSWDDRRAGVDRVRTRKGEELSLFSQGGQSSPAPGWELLLTKQADSGVEWTLYGIGSL